MAMAIVVVVVVAGRGLHLHPWGAPLSIERGTQNVNEWIFIKSRKRLVEGERRLDITQKTDRERNGLTIEIKRRASLLSIPALQPKLKGPTTSNNFCSTAPCCE